MRDTSESWEPAQQAWRLTGRHVLAILIGFFGVVFSVNGYFLSRALSTHTGVVSVEPYRQGLAYNLRIAADERQTALGWRDVVRLMPDGAVSVTITTPDGAPVGGLMVEGVLARPATASADIALQLNEIGSGQYIARTNAPAPGAWIVAIEARRRDETMEPVYRARRRLWLEP